MKKGLAILTIGFCFGFSINAYAEIHIEKCNPGKKGYRDIFEGHSNNTGDHTLLCEEQGDKACVWKNPPPISGDLSLSDIEQMVLNQIEMGITTGSEILPNGNTITWDGSLTCYKIDIEQ